jgi:acetolactate synthase-1/3 small subunit
LPISSEKYFCYNLFHWKYFIFMKKTLSLTVFNEAGILSRISTMFSSRGFNIDSISIGSSEQPGISRMVVVIQADDLIIEQAIKQLYKLVQVIQVVDLSDQASVERELMLIKVGVTATNRWEVVELAEIFKTKIVDVANVSVTMEVSGDPGKVATLIALLKRFPVIEIVRTGKIAVARGLGINTELMKYNLIDPENI